VKPAAEGRTLGGVRFPFAAGVALVLAAAAGAAILYMSRHFYFYYDEWDWVLGAPTWDARAYFVPHSEHWSTIPSIVYRVLMLAVGARTYVPYMAVLMVLHCAVCVLLFLIVRRRGGDALAIAALAVLLVLGRGYENILWAFQIGFVGSVLGGLVAMWLLDADRVPWWRCVLASAALIASLMSSGIGIPSCAAVAAQLVLDRDGRRRLWLLVPPAAAYLAWTATVGRAGLTGHRDPFTLVAVGQLLHYAPTGIGAAAAGLVGLDAVPALTALAVLAVVVGVGWGRFGLRPIALGAGAGLVVQFVVIGLVRAQIGDAEAASSRYVYIGSVFLLILLMDIARHLRLRGAWTPVIAAVVIVSLVLNARALHDAARAKDVLFAAQRDELQTAWALRDARGADRSVAIDPGVMPNLPIGRYIQSRAAHGSPYPDAGPADLSRLPPAQVNEVMAQAFPMRLRGTLQVPSPGVCTSAPAPGRPVTVTAPEGSQVVVKTAGPGQVSVQVWYAGQAAPSPPPPAHYPRDATLVPSENLFVEVPPSGLHLTLHVQAKTAAAINVPTICVAP
jgi:hypothetical protein